MLTSWNECSWAADHDHGHRSRNPETLSASSSSFFQGYSSLQSSFPHRPLLCCHHQRWVWSLLMRSNVCSCAADQGPREVARGPRRLPARSLQGQGSLQAAAAVLATHHRRRPCRGEWVWGLGFVVQGLGFRVECLCPAQESASQAATRNMFLATPRALKRRSPFRQSAQPVLLIISVLSMLALLRLPLLLNLLPCQTCCTCPPSRCAAHPVVFFFSLWLRRPCDCVNVRECCVTALRHSSACAGGELHGSD